MPWGQRAHYKEMTDNRARAAVCHLHSAHALVSLCSKRRDDVNKRERGCFPTMTYTKETQETRGFPRPCCVVGPKEREEELVSRYGLSRGRSGRGRTGTQLKRGRFALPRGEGAGGWSPVVARVNEQGRNIHTLYTNFTVYRVLWAPLALCFIFDSLKKITPI